MVDLSQTAWQFLARAIPEKNLKLAIAGETYEVEEMYPAYIEVAKFQEEKGAQRSFEWSWGTEKMLILALSRFAKFADIPLKEKRLMSVPYAVH
jgi:rubrerythrin